MAHVKLPDGREFDADSAAELDYYRAEGAVITGEEVAVAQAFPKVFDGDEYVEPAPVDPDPAVEVPVEQPGGEPLDLSGEQSAAEGTGEPNDGVPVVEGETGEASNPPKPRRS